MDKIADSIISRGDLAHLTLFLWAVAASSLALTLLRELASANKRFDEFVRELSRFNRRIKPPGGKPAKPKPINKLVPLPMEPFHEQEQPSDPQEAGSQKRPKSSGRHRRVHPRSGMP